MRDLILFAGLLCLAPAQAPAATGWSLESCVRGGCVVQGPFATVTRTHTPAPSFTQTPTASPTPVDCFSFQFRTQWGPGDFSNLQGVAVSGIGEAHGVRTSNAAAAFSLLGGYRRTWGSIGGAGGFVHADKRGKLYVTDIGANKVKVYDELGVFLFEFGANGSGPGQSAANGDLAVDAAGNIYIADQILNRVSKRDPSGAFLMHFGDIPGPGQLGGALGVAVAPDGSVFVCDRANRRIAKYQADGTFLFTFDGSSSPQGQIAASSGLGMDSAGRVYLAEDQGHRIRVFDGLGNQITVFGVLGNGPGQLNRPWDVDLDADGNLYIANFGNNMISRWDLCSNAPPAPSATPTQEAAFCLGFEKLWGNQDSQHPENLGQPSGVAVDAGGNPLASDLGGKLIKLYNPEGELSSSFGGQGGGNGLFQNPWKLDVDPSGRILVGDFSLSKVQVFNSSGAFLFQFGSPGSGNGQFQSLDATAAGPDGSIYVSDLLQHRIQKFNSSGVFQLAFGSQGSFAGQFNRPVGVEVDALGRVYVADSQNSRIQAFDPDGAYIRSYGMTDTGVQLLSNPVDVTVDSAGRLYVLDTAGNQIKVLDAQGRLLFTTGGTGGAPGLFNTPRALQVSQDGRVYVADSGNNRIQKFSPCPAVSSTPTFTPAPDLRPDLVPLPVSLAGLSGDYQALTVGGTLEARVQNLGASAAGPFQVIFFSDINLDGAYTSGLDQVLGSVNLAGLAQGASILAQAPASGTVRFRDDLVYALADSLGGVDERRESNNYSSSGPACASMPFSAAMPLKIQWLWQGSVASDTHTSLICAPAVADLDGDGIPDAIFSTDQTLPTPPGYIRTGYLSAVRGSDGSLLFQARAENLKVDSTCNPAVGDIDLDGRPEIVAVFKDSRRVIAFEHDGRFKWISPDLEALLGHNIRSDSPALADLNGDGYPEIVIGKVALDRNGQLLWVGTAGSGGLPEYFGGINSTVVADLEGDGQAEVIAGATVYRADGSLYWSQGGFGYAAVGNFDGDAFPEIVVASQGQLSLYQHDGTPIWGPVTLAGVRGSPPLVADLDNDGLPEIGVNNYGSYQVFEHDGTLKWQVINAPIGDGIEGAVAFDLDADGSLEIVYANRAIMYVFAGPSGAIRATFNAPVQTHFLYPVIADVDGDGHAEILLPAGSNDPLETRIGLYAIRDPLDAWAAARTVWNQHSYHATNINDDLSIPPKERPNWLLFNNYRTQIPGDCPVYAPDLTASKLSYEVLGNTQRLTMRVGNGGIEATAREVFVSFYDFGPSGPVLGSAATSGPLAPGEFQDLSITLPISRKLYGPLWAIADNLNGFGGSFPEPYEGNNAHNSLVTVNATETISPTPTISITPSFSPTHTPSPSAGPSGTATPTPPAFPNVIILAPSDGDSVTHPVNVTGTVQTAFLDHWVLEIRDLEGQTFTTLATGTSQVNANALGRLDPTLLENGFFELRLTAFDTQGQTSAFSVTVLVRGQMKVGNFSLSFTDLEIPVSGLPIRAVRSYDSRLKRQGDFGIGWTLSLRHIRLQEKGVAGQGWQTTFQDNGLFFPDRYCLVATRAKAVVIAMPDGKTLEFDVNVTSPSNSGAGCQTSSFSLVSLKYQARPGTTATLESLDYSSQTLALSETDFPSNPVLLLNSDGNIFDPQQYRLTLEDGTEFIFDQNNDGLQSVKDLNNNVLTINSTGVRHSSGKEIVFTRDPQGRITQIEDPNGEILQYSYDAAGDLVTFTDRENGVTTFTYDAQHNLTDLEDPNGDHPLANQYGPDGRLEKHFDSFGKEIAYTHDIDGRRETVRDRLNNLTIHDYDDRGNVLKTTDARGGETFMSYDSRDNKLSETNAEGENSTFTYDGEDHLLTQANHLGHTTHYSYDPAGRVLTVQDPEGNVTTNSYDARGNLQFTQDAGGAFTSFSYDPSGNLQNQNGPLGTGSSFSYDSSGNLQTQTDAQMNVSSHSYDPNGNRLSESRPSSAGTQLTSFEYDGCGRLKKTTHPNTTSIRSVYDPAGRVISRFDALNRETVMEYDAQGQLKKTTYPDLTFEESAYDAEGRRISSKDRAGRETTFAYDELGRLTKTAFADGSFTETTYDRVGRVLTEKDELGNVTTFEYDDAGRRTKIINALSQITQFLYDNNGNLSSQLDARNNSFSFDYDNLNRRTRSNFPGGTYTESTYDALGRRTRERDQAGIETSYEYDTLGRLVAVVDARGGRTEYTYDAAGNQLTQEDAMGRITRFEYDNMNRRTKRKLPLLQEELYGYDTVGNLNAKTNFNGQLISYTHDSNNRLATKTYPSRAESYLYSPTGRRTKMTINGQDTNYGYDLRDRLTSKSSAEGTLGYTYDLHGNLKTVDTLTPNGVRITYHYDVLNRIQSVLDRRTGLSTVYAYDPNGNLESTTLPNNLKTTHTYDPQNRLTLMETVNQTTSTLLKSFAYQLNHSGHRTRLTEGDGRVSRWNYDDLYRLTTETISADPSGINGFVSYIYDSVGNRQSRVSTLPGITNQSFSYDDNDRLTTDGYDDNGSTLASGTSTYSYDAETKLTSANVNGHAITMTYDGDGNRTSKTVDGTTMTYLVDTNNPTGYSQVFEERESGTLTKVYLYGLDLIAQDHIGATGYRYFGYDGLGSARFLIDSGGNVTDSYKYDAYGARLDLLDSASSYLFTGENFDQDLNSYYLRARFNDYERGRFKTMDSYLGLRESPLGLHKYNYANANPVGFFDPSGHYASSSGIDSYSRALGRRFWSSRSNVPDAQLLVPVGTLAYSEDGVDFIKSWETFYSSPYDDNPRARKDSKVSSTCTIGYGTVLHSGLCVASDFIKPMTFAEGDISLRLELNDWSKELIRRLSPATYLSQTEFDSLLSLVFNRGGNAPGMSVLYSLIQNGKRTAAAALIDSPQFHGNFRGNVDRRLAESVLFEYGIYYFSNRGYGDVLSEEVDREERCQCDN